MKTQLGWINFLKGLSILAVIMDHLYGVVYENRGIQIYSQFSVTLFIFLAGITSVISIERNTLSMKEYQIKRLRVILIPYVIATVAYEVILSHRFDFSVFWNDLILFKATSPFYFILFYCQLILVAPILYKLLAKKHIIIQLCTGFVIYIISKYLIYNTNLGGIYGGGGNILGGSYLFVFFIGMMFYLYYQKYSDKFKYVWVYVLGIIVAIALIYIDRKIGWLELGFANPPRKYTIFYSLSVFLLGYSIYAIAIRWRYSKSLISLFEMIGKYSLYIFLYHKLAIIYAYQYAAKMGIVPNAVLKSIWIILFSIFVPLLIGILAKNWSKISKMKYIRKVYS